MTVLFSLKKRTTEYPITGWIGGTPNDDRASLSQYVEKQHPSFALNQVRDAMKSPLQANRSYFFRFDDIDADTMILRYCEASCLDTFNGEPHPNFHPAEYIRLNNRVMTSHVQCQQNHSQRSTPFFLPVSMSLVGEADQPKLNCLHNQVVTISYDPTSGEIHFISNSTPSLTASIKISL